MAGTSSRSAAARQADLAVRQFVVLRLPDETDRKARERARRTVQLPPDARVHVVDDGFELQALKLALGAVKVITPACPDARTYDADHWESKRWPALETETL